MLKKICILMALLTAGFTVTAFADVPDPYGRPRPRPELQEVQEMTILRQEVYGNPINRPEEAMLRLVVGAPRKSVVTYTLLDAENQLMAEDSSEVVGNAVYFQIYFPKPPRNNGQEYRLQLNCSLDVIKTSFGYKIAEKPVYTAQEEHRVLVNCDDERNCRIELK